MPRGKYVNHKGKSRHFTSPEELQQEKGEESSEGEGSSSTEEAAGPSGRQAKIKPKSKKVAESSEESSDEDSGEDRDAKKGVASLIEIENPNRAVKKAAQKISNLSIDAETSSSSQAKPELTRREREQIEKQKARQRYEKLHAAGKTTEAKADLARLALIRQQREEAAAKRAAEKAHDEKKGPGSNK